MSAVTAARLVLVAASTVVATACASSGEATGEATANQTAFRVPAEGSCEAKAMLSVANDATHETLDVDAGLSRSAADAIIAARPIPTVAALDAVAQVGPAALSAIFELAKAQGLTAGCTEGGCTEGGASSTELGIISDLDDTVIPEAEPDLAKAPFPGVKALYQLIERRTGGKPGDVYYVTARGADRVAEVPAYLAAHGIPGGPIETGVSGVPFIARPEKVRDIERILAKTGTQRFVFFGDTSHVDPDVQRDILAAHPDRMVAGIILKTTTNVTASRLVGLHLVHDYAEASAVLFKLGSITRDEALGVMRSAHEDGLEISEARMKDLLDAPLE
jgi:hypothetical protein